MEILINGRYYHANLGIVQVLAIDSDRTAMVMVKPVKEPDRAYFVPRGELQEEK